MFRFIFIGLLLSLSLWAQSVNIAVAANVSYAIKDLIKAFNITHPTTKINVTLGSSGKLTAQINHGAPYELFMSANMKYPQNLYTKNKASTLPKVYALGGLALLSKKPQDFNQGLALLQQAKIKRIAIANPKTAPYGKAAFEALKNAQLLKVLKPKFIYGESISQTVSYTVTAANIGIIAKSSLYSKQMQHFKANTHYTDVPASLYTPIEQGIVLLNNPTKEAQAFYDFILSSQAQNIFKQYGYLLP